MRFQTKKMENAGNVLGEITRKKKDIAATTIQSAVRNKRARGTLKTIQNKSMAQGAVNDIIHNAVD